MIIALHLANLIKARTLKTINFNVQAGRKGSKDTAKCFLNWFKTKGVTTFNHHPAKLNFAVKGALDIIIINPNGTSNDNILQDVVLAQGHTTRSRNNWWIGGVHCTTKSHHRIACTAVNSLGNNVPPVCFHRESGYINRIDMVNC